MADFSLICSSFPGNSRAEDYRRKCDEALVKFNYKPVSQSCAVAESDKFWWTTLQSNLQTLFREWQEPRLQELVEHRPERLYAQKTTRIRTIMRMSIAASTCPPSNLQTPQQKLPKFGFRTQATALWLMERSSILSAKFDCPVHRQDLSLLVFRVMLVKLEF